jgi:hypothetical protein
VNPTDHSQIGKRSEIAANTILTHSEPSGQISRGNRFSSFNQGNDLGSAFIWGHRDFLFG